MLLVQRRNSYAYGDFILGKYDAADNDRLTVLFNGMTSEEKAVLATMNFDSIWHHLWLGVSPRWASFSICQSRFFMTFRGPQGATKLMRLISTSTNSPRIWSTPKGRKESGESVLQCAVREFTEETTYPKTENYQLLPQLRHEYSHMSENVRYSVITFVGVAFSREDARSNAFHTPNVDATNHWQIHEISDIRWMSIQDMKHTAGAERICAQAKLILEKFRNYRRKLFRTVPEKNMGDAEVSADSDESNA
jgi:8-oxo-dGTP pyrophosphatase MutT (NUDIX family)